MLPFFTLGEVRASSVVLISPPLVLSLPKKRREKIRIEEIRIEH